MNAMGGRSDDEIDALLSEGRFPGPTKDRVFEGALRDAGVGDGRAPRARPSWRSRLAITAGLSLAAGVAALVLVPRASRQDDPFRAKGTGAAFEMDVACVGKHAASLAACPQGATLVFSIAPGGSGPGYLAGYADPTGGGERIWYFSADGETPAIPTASAGATAPFSRAIRIGPEHAPGAYRVSLFMTRAPVGKAALAPGAGPADVIATHEVTLQVVPPPADYP